MGRSWRRGALAVTTVVGVLLAGAVAVERWGEDPYGGAFTGPCSMTTDANDRSVAELRLIDHGPLVSVGKIAVGFADDAGHQLPMVRTMVSHGSNVPVAHAQTRTFTVAAPAAAKTCEFLDWAEAQSPTWGGRGAG